MAISYSENNKRKIVYEPLLSRQRLIYKGPVASSVINLANDQFLMDVNRLNKKIKDIEILIDQTSEMSRNNMALKDADTYANDDMSMTVYAQHIYWDEDSSDYLIESATPFYEDELEFNKPQLNSALITQMHRKLDLIEDALKNDD